MTARDLPVGFGAQRDLLVPTAALAGGVMVGLLAGRPIDQPVIYAATAALAAIVFVAPRQGFWLVVGLAVVEGFLRNLVDNPQVVLAKDALLLILYLRAVALAPARRALPITASLIGPIVLFVGIVVVECLNPNVPTLLQAVVGLREWLLYAGLFFVVPILYPRPDALRVICFGVAFLGLISAIVGTIQWFLGSSAYTSLGSAFARSVFVVGFESGSVYRPTALFSYSSHYASFLGVAILVTAGFLAGARGRWTLIAGAALATLLVAAILENQRATFALLPLELALILWVARRFSLAATFVAVGAVGVAAAIVAGGDASVTRVVDVFVNPSGDRSLRVDGYLYAISMALRHLPLGDGTGTTAIGARYVTGEYAFIEFFAAKVIWEFGIPGAVAWIALLGAMARTLFHGARSAFLSGQPVTGGLLAGAIAVLANTAYFGYQLAGGAIATWAILGAATAVATKVIESDGVDAAGVPELALPLAPASGLAARG